MDNGATAALTASYNPAGLPATLTRSAAATTFGYDAINRLNAPSPGNRPGSDANLNDSVGFCCGTRIGNLGTNSIC